MVNITPIKNRVLLKQVEKEVKTTSGIVLPDEKKKGGSLAEVVAVGFEVQIVKIGDKVYFNPYSVEPVEHEKQTYLIAKEDEILAVVKE